MSPRFWISLCSTGLALTLLGAMTHDAFAQRGGGRGGRGAAGTTGSSTGFSRDGAAAGGGLSSKSGGGAAGKGAQASGQSAESRGQNQAARQESLGTAQSSRQQSRQGMQEQRIEAYDDNHWDQGKGLAIAGTAALAVGTVSAISSATAAPPPAAAPAGAPAPATIPPPCENAQVTAAGDINYYKCGSAWYTLAYGANGPAYVQSAPPQGG